ncbi:hypothetical protein ColKHC_04916 [Colletotrichum higginsianum]|nr:hypothetical protein ColKHC_04916 [Colletotrichum higginsianum]
MLEISWKANGGWIVRTSVSKPFIDRRDDHQAGEEALDAHSMAKATAASYFETDRHEASGAENAALTVERPTTPGPARCQETLHV